MVIALLLTARLLAVVLQIIGGNDQAVALDPSSQNAFFAPVVLVLTNDDGTPVANAQIGVTCSVGTPLVCRMDSRGRTSTTVTTNSLGYAVVANDFSGTYGSVVAYGGLGPVPLTATYLSATATANLSIVSQYLLTIVGGNQQTPVYVPSYQGLPQFWLFTTPLTVLVSDRAGHAVTSGNVTFSCTPPPGVANLTIPSCVLGLDSQGVATSNTVPITNGMAQQWIVPPGATPPPWPYPSFVTCNYAGTYTIVATYQDATATFTEVAAPSTTNRRPHLPSDTSVCYQINPRPRTR